MGPTLSLPKTHCANCTHFFSLSLYKTGTRLLLTARYDLAVQTTRWATFWRIIGSQFKVLHVYPDAYYWPSSLNARRTRDTVLPYRRDNEFQIPVSYVDGPQWLLCTSWLENHCLLCPILITSTHPITVSTTGRYLNNSSRNSVDSGRLNTSTLWNNASKWSKPQCNLQVDGLVKDGITSPLQWLLARVISTHPSTHDNIVIVVTIRTAGYT